MNMRSTLLGLVLGLGVMMLAGAAAAQCCTTPPPPVCCTTPPPCCTTPPPPPVCCRPPPSDPPDDPPPPSAPPEDPNGNIHVHASNVAIAIAGGRAGAGAGAGAGAVYYGGGYGGGYTAPMASGSIQLNVDGGKRMRQVAYEASRMRTRRVVIQAVCIDARQIPHPASQVRPDRDIDAAFDGELYRCIAGSWLQATIADFDGKVDFSGGKTLACGKGDALYHGRGGKLECRRQAPARDCNERSLLRRFGAGIKVLTITEIEKYTAYREEEERVTESAATSMSLDGGVGGYVY